MFYEHKNGRKLLDQLNGDMGKRTNDGAIILGFVEDLLDSKVNHNNLGRNEEETVIKAFNSFLSEPTLYRPTTKIDDTGNHSPLWKFTSDLASDFGYITKGTDEDILGDFYSIFVRYGNNNGKDLGIVLTPSHITKLMAKMINVNYNDYLLDPVAGSATFLSSGMNQMIHSIPKSFSKDKKQKIITDIKHNHLVGVERDPLVYSIAISNMILRGDGNSSILHDDFFNCGLKINNKNKLKDKKYTNHVHVKHPITKILMNPPYSQGKKDPEQAEIYFIQHALQMLHEGGKLSAIVPISIVVSGGRGVKNSSKNPMFDTWKKWILTHCRIDSVVTMNPNTFYPAGTQTIIINLTKTHEGQNGHEAKLINFADDGYKLIPKHGMQPNGTKISKLNRLFNILKNGSPNNRYVQNVIPKDNKPWLFNAYYTVPIHPTDNDFQTTVANYLIFKANAKLNGHEDLFKENNNND